MYGRWSWRGLLAYTLGFSAMVPFFSTRFYVGPMTRTLRGVDVAMPIGLAVSAVAYFFASRSLDIGEDRRRAAAADLGLD
jgi:nucleobase:cation symporter-1, NCS1 family